MSLRGVFATLSNDGSPAILLQKDSLEGPKTLETLPIKRATPEQRNFIISSWLKSYEAQARKQGYGSFYKRYEPLVAESRWQDCWVVTDEDGFTVHAWVCGSSGQLFHCYVVPELRRLRVATRLIEFAVGPMGLKEYAKPWPYSAHARVNPYLLKAKEVHQARSSSGDSLCNEPRTYQEPPVSER